ncbi:MAG: hypothetical protein QW660_03615 [Candidatus Bathyarchaeia archaeon]
MKRLLASTVLAVLLGVMILLPCWLLCEECCRIIRSCGLFQDAEGFIRQGMAIIAFTVITVLLLLIVELNTSPYVAFK